MNQPPLNPDAIFTAGDVIHENFGAIRKIDHLACTAIAERAVSAYLAVAQPEVNSVEELDALPPDSYVRGWDGFKHAKTRSGDWVLCVEHTRGAHKAESIELPARVLYRPTEEASNGR